MFHVFQQFREHKPPCSIHVPPCSTPGSWAWSTDWNMVGTHHLSLMTCWNVGTQFLQVVVTEISTPPGGSPSPHPLGGPEGGRATSVVEYAAAGVRLVFEGDELQGDDMTSSRSVDRYRYLAAKSAPATPTDQLPVNLRGPLHERLTRRSGPSWRSRGTLDS